MDDAGAGFEYSYNAVVTRVYDGDTVTVNIDLGFGVWLRSQTLRLFGINTPEIRGAERPRGLVSRDWLVRRILHERIILRSHKDEKGKYGRWLATIFHNGENVNDKMVSLGLAEYREY